MKRIYSIDLVRGLVMVIMALDHVRDILHTTSTAFQPTDLDKTNPILFFTRWVTHLCAPTFVFLSGVSVFLSMEKQRDLSATKRFLRKRGLWLIVLECTLVNFGVWFDIHFKVLLFDVIAAIGVGFIVLSFLIQFSTRTIAIIGLSILFLHNLAPLVPGAETSIWKQVAMPLFAPAAFPLPAGHVFVMGYPPVPWLGIMLAGFAAGRIFRKELCARKLIFFRLGLCSILLFLLLRSVNIYGDTLPWSRQKTGVLSLLSFLNLTKYPPSLDFCLLFLGLMFILLATLDGVENRFTKVMAVFGRVPLFYFLFHWYIIHPLLFLINYIQGYPPAEWVFGFNFGRPANGGGIPLWAVYLVWLGTVMLLYPICRWYDRYKQTHSAQWLRYL